MVTLTHCIKQFGVYFLIHSRTIWNQKINGNLIYIPHSNITLVLIMTFNANLDCFEILIFILYCTLILVIVSSGIWSGTVPQHILVFCLCVILQSTCLLVYRLSKTLVRMSASNIGLERNMIIFVLILMMLDFDYSVNLPSCRFFNFKNTIFKDTSLEEKM